MSNASQSKLMLTARFAPFFWTQFLGAFNDNIFKNAIILLITFHAADLMALSVNSLVNLCAVLFILPFFLFSALAGQLADKYEKSKLIQYIKLWELGLMLLAALGFYLDSLMLLISILFLLGIQSAFFGPIKYSILPQHLRDSELVAGNGLVSMGTFTAILLGTLVAGILSSLGVQKIHWISLSVIGVALTGYVVSRWIPTATPSDCELKVKIEPVSQTWRVLKHAHAQPRVVFLSIMGISWFWLFGALLITQLPNYCKLYLGGNEIIVTFVLIMATVGIALGALLCDKLSGHKVEIGLVPFGAIGLTIFTGALYWIKPYPSLLQHSSLSGFLYDSGNIAVLIHLMLIGLFGGFFIVPLYALIQQRSKPQYRSRIIAANNVLNALFMVIGSTYAIILYNFKITIPQLFLITSILNAIVALFIFTLVPEFLMRFITWIIIHTVYRIKRHDLEKYIPETGAAVITCNHASFIDALIISAYVRRPIRFVMYHRIFETPFLRFMFKTAKAIPIAPAKESPEIKTRAFEAIATALQQGELIGIFPEGSITRDGELHTFKPGIEQIIRKTPVPIIPLAINSVWGSIFSRKPENIFSRAVKTLCRKIHIRAAPPVMPDELTAKGLQDITEKLLEIG